MTLEPPRLQRTSAPPITVPFRNYRAAAPSPEEEHFAAAYLLLVEHRGLTATRRNHCAVAILRLLCSRPTFRQGHRVAWSVPRLANLVGRDTRTVERAIACLRGIPGLLQILNVQPNQPDWKGAPTRFEHLEWQEGSVLRSKLGALSVATAPGTAPVPPRHDAGGPPGTTPPDLPSDPLCDEKLKTTPTDHDPSAHTPNLTVKFCNTTLPIQQATEHPAQTAIATTTTVPKATKPASAGSALSQHLSSDQLLTAESEVRVQARERSGRAGDETRTQLGQPQLKEPSTSAPQPMDSPTRAHTAERERLAQPSSPPAASARPRSASSASGELSRPRGLLVAIIRQHHTIAGKPRFSVVYDEELLAVDGALHHLGGGRSNDDLVQLCARVSELAVRDSRASGDERTTVAYAFGGLDDKPHKFFLDRVSRLRELDEQLAKELQDGELAASLFGLRRPVKTTPRPPQRMPSRPHARPPRPRDNTPIPASQLAAQLDEFRTQYARAG
jgi:hypothetical protein